MSAETMETDPRAPSREPVDVLVDHYRCPDDLVAWTVEDPPGGDPGYFAFGRDMVLYGRLGRAVPGQPDGSLPDVWLDVTPDGPAVRLTFAPGEVIENLRRERYASAFRPHARYAGAGGLLRRGYYLTRDLLPAPVRRGLQRLYLRSGRARPFPRWPLDTTVETLLERLLALALRHRGLDRVPFVWFWPEGARACLMITHDVETALGRDACTALMDLDARFGFHSSFQLIPEGRYALPDRLVREMRARGFELNLHDLNHDGYLFDERDEFLRRVARINDHARALGARGFRSGALYRNAEWLEALAVDFDMSIPNVGHLDPQPGGSCTVRPYFIGELVELPLTTTQDYTLFHLLGDYSLALWQRQVEGIVAHHGLVSFNVHPDYIAARRARGTYVELLRWLHDLRADEAIWAALPGDVERWWRARREMRVVERSGTWVVEGPDAARARLAWAVLEGGRLVFRMA
jgi:hypothetical protein